MFNDNLLQFNHSCTFFKSSFTSLHTTLISVPVWNIFVSSANNREKQYSETLDKSLIYIKNNKIIYIMSFCGIVLSSSSTSHLSYLIKSSDRICRKNILKSIVTEIMMYIYILFIFDRLISTGTLISLVFHKSNHNMIYFQIKHLFGINCVLFFVTIQCCFTIPGVPSTWDFHWAIGQP